MGTLSLVVSTIYIYASTLLSAPIALVASADDKVEEGINVETTVAAPMGDLRVMTITAYSSSRDETDSTPFITAAGTRTRDGVVATNGVPFGTRLKIPEYFGDKVFTVEDRMHPRHAGRVDIWFPSKRAALRFGIVTTHVEFIHDEVANGR